MEKGLEHRVGSKIGNVQFEGEQKTGYTLLQASQCREDQLAEPGDLDLPLYCF